MIVLQANKKECLIITKNFDFFEKLTALCEKTKKQLFFFKY